MKNIFNFYLILLFLFYTGCSNQNGKSISGNSISQNEIKQYSRVISLAPSITEVIYAVGGEEQLIAVTDFCKYPVEAQKKIKIGGFMNINFEVLLNLNPDLVFILPSHAESTKKLEQLGINYKIIAQRTFKDIKKSIITIGSALNKKNKASKLSKQFENKIQTFKKQKNKNRKKVLISVTRNYGELKNIFAAGRNIFYNDLIELAGGVNAVPESSMEYPMLNSESIIALNPDIIIEIISPESDILKKVKPDYLKKDWLSLKTVNAVANNKIFYIIKDYAVIPGPRILKLLDDFNFIIR